MKKQESTFSLIENKTGQIFGADVKLIRQYIGGYWMILNLEIGDFLAKSDLQGASYKVYWYIIAHLNYGNTFPTSKRIATALSMNASNVRRAFQELNKIGAIVKEDNTSLVNPRFAWRGSRAEQFETVKRLEGKGVKL